VAVALGIQGAAGRVERAQPQALVAAASPERDDGSGRLEAERLPVAGAKRVHGPQPGQCGHQRVERVRGRGGRGAPVENPAAPRPRGPEAPRAGLDLELAHRTGPHAEHVRAADGLRTGEAARTLDHHHERRSDDDQQQQRQDTPQRSPRAPADRHHDESAQKDEPGQHHGDGREQAARLRLGEDER